MKAFAICLLALCLTFVALVRRPTAVAGQACASPADDHALRAIAQQWMDSYNQGNAAQVAALYADDAYYLTQHFTDGIVHPRPMIQAYVQHGVDARYHVDSIDVLMTSCSGDFAYAITRYRSTNGSQRAMGVNLVVLRKISGSWRIVAHEAAVPDAGAIQTLAPIGQ
ncbi:MAG TPA: nuclear transport factor 2 family protein [Terriglobales bacterium]|nr:nuclear transport factor 2 family protein [Terriglobales bacterium]